MDGPSQEARNQLRDTPTVSSGLDDGALVELVYDPEARTTALVVFKNGAWTVERELALPSGERLVPFAPTNNLIKHSVVLLPSAPEEYGSVEELLSAIGSYLHRYIDLIPSFAKMATYYVLLTWLYDAFEELPYLRFQGDYGTGKTRALLVLGSLCYKPFFASGASTVSPVFHTLDAFRGTLIFDEADFRFSDEKAEMVKILNNGNVKGMPVLRTVLNRNREFNPRAFQVYGPKIVAMRGSYDDRALESRFLTEEMGRAALRSDIPINLPPEYRDEALHLRNQLLLYRFRSLHRVKPDPSLVQQGLEPRLNQVLVPLLSVMEDEEARQSLRQLARGSYSKIVAERGLSTEAQLLSIIRDMAKATEKLSLPISQLATRFLEVHGADYGGRVSPRWIGTILRRRLHLSPVKSHGVYVLPLTDSVRLHALYVRYGLLEDGDSAQHIPTLSTDASPSPRVDEVDVGDIGADAAERSTAT